MHQPVPDRCAIIDRLGAIAGDYDVILCDVWGVVHDGVTALREPCAALRRYREAGGTVVLITNAPRPARAVMEQIDGFGVPRETYDTIVSSGDVTVALMTRHGQAPFYYVGPLRDLALLEVGWAGPDPLPPRVTLDKAVYVVCAGLVDDETERPEDYDPLLDTMQERDLPMICANPDLVVYRGAKLLPCAGAIAARYADKGGVAIYAGKPHEPIYEMSIEAARTKRGEATPMRRVLAVGDAMRTDIAGAGRFGIDSLFITNGVHRDELHGADGFLDRARYAQFLAGGRSQPRAAMAELVW